MQVEILTAASETTNINTSTSAAVGNYLWKDAHEFTHQLQGIAKNIHALTSRVETVEIHAVENADSYFTDMHKDQLEKHAFDIYDTCRLSPKLKHDILLISNKLESCGRIDCNEYYLSHDKEADQCFLDQKSTICIFVDAVSILHAIGATVVHTFEPTLTIEEAKKK